MLGTPSSLPYQNTGYSIMGVIPFFHVVKRDEKFVRTPQQALRELIDEARGEDGYYMYSGDIGAKDPDSLEMRNDGRSVWKRDVMRFCADDIHNNYKWGSTYCVEIHDWVQTEEKGDERVSIGWAFYGLAPS